MKVQRTKTVRRKRADLKKLASHYASSALGRIEPGCRLIGLTNGRFSLVDIIAEVLKATGRADVYISSWTAAIDDMAELVELRDQSKIREIILMVDKSTPGRGKDYLKKLHAMLGNNVFFSRVHAKFVVIQNADWNVTIRTSMNLNRNIRIEQFDLDDDPEIAEFFIQFMKDVSNFEHIDDALMSDRLRPKRKYRNQ